MPSPSLRLAVVGAGAAGLAAARELRREGHAPVVFERAAAVGGTWLYAAPASAATTDPLGAAATHSSLYASLRTNLPREVMGFLDFPFTAASSAVDTRRFPGHQEVLRYLEDFARRFDLYGIVRFETEQWRTYRVCRVGHGIPCVPAHIRILANKTCSSRPPLGQGQFVSIKEKEVQLFSGAVHVFHTPRIDLNLEIISLALQPRQRATIGDRPTPTPTPSRSATETEVVGVRREAGGRWAVTSRKLGEKGEQDEEVYDAVVVCNGHYTEPRIASIPGADAWPGKQMHSHNYRVPEPFLDEVVIVIGASASAFDISRDIASVAKEVHIADRSAPASTCEQQPGYDNMWLHSMIDRAQEDGSVIFQDGNSIKADVIMHCTGYMYDFPFLGDDSTISVDDNCVDPLYKHVFPIEVAPDLSFIGLPWKVIPFPLFELQSKWVASILSGRIKLPSKDEMMEDVKAIYMRREIRGWPKRYAHNFSGGYQFEYDDWLAEQCGHPPIEEWRKLMYAANSKNKAARPESYRDEWDDDHLVAQANEDFKKYL